MYQVMQFRSQNEKTKNQYLKSILKVTLEYFFIFIIVIKHYLVFDRIYNLDIASLAAPSRSRSSFTDLFTSK